MSYEDILEAARNGLNDLEVVTEVLVFRLKNGIGDYFISSNGANYDDFGYPIIVNPSGTDTNDIEIIDISNIVKSYGFSSENQFAADQCDIDIANIDGIFSPENITYLEFGDRFISDPVIPSGIMSKMPLESDGSYLYNPNYHKNDARLNIPLFNENNIIKVREGIVVDGEIQWQDSFIGLITGVTPSNNASGPQLKVICHDFLRLLNTAACNRVYVAPIVNHDFSIKSPKREAIIYSQKVNASKYGKAPSNKKDNFQYGFNDTYSYPDSYGGEELAYQGDMRTWSSKNGYWSKVPEPKVFLANPGDNPATKKTGYLVKYYNGTEPVGTPVKIKIQDEICFTGKLNDKPVDEIIDPNNWCCVIEANISYKNTSKIALFSVLAEGGVEVFWDGVSIGSKSGCRARSSTRKSNSDIDPNAPFTQPTVKYETRVDSSHIPVPVRTGGNEDTGLIYWIENTSIVKNNRLKIVYRCGQSFGAPQDTIKYDANGEVLKTAPQILGWRNILVLSAAESSAYPVIMDNYSNLNAYKLTTESLPNWFPSYIRSTTWSKEGPGRGQSNSFDSADDSHPSELAWCINGFLFGSVLKENSSFVVNPYFQIKADDQEYGYNILYTRGQIEFKKPIQINEVGLTVKVRYAYKLLSSANNSTKSIIEDIIIEEVLGVERYLYDPLSSSAFNKYKDNPLFTSIATSKIRIPEPSVITESLKLTTQTTKNAFDAVSKVLQAVGSNFKLKADGTGKFIGEVVIQNGAPIFTILEKIGNTNNARTSFKSSNGTIDLLAKVSNADESPWTAPSPRSSDITEREFFSLAAIGFNYEQDPDRWVDNGNGTYFISDNFRRESLIIGEVCVDKPGTVDPDDNTYLSPSHAYRKLIFTGFKNLTYDPYLKAFVDSSSLDYPEAAKRKIVNAFALYRRYWSGSRWVWERYEFAASQFTYNPDNGYYEIINLDKIIYNSGKNGTICYPGSPTVLLIGGIDYTDSYRNDTVQVDLYDNAQPEAYNLSSSVSLSNPRAYSVSVCAENGYIYIIGGVAPDGSYIGDIERARINLDKTGINDPSPVFGVSLVKPRKNFSAVATRDRIYVIGGEDSSGKLSSIEVASIYPNGGISTFVEIPTKLMSVRTGHSAFISNDYLYVVGGEGLDRTLDTIEIAKINQNGELSAFYLAQEKLPEARTGFSLSTYRGYLFISGGKSSSGSIMNTIIRAKIIEGGVSSVSTMPNILAIGRYGHASTIYKDKLYIIAGVSDSGVRRDIEYATLSSSFDIGSFNQHSPGYMPQSNSVYGFAAAILDPYSNFNSITKKESDLSLGKILEPKTDTSLSAVTEFSESPGDDGFTVKGTPLFVDYDFKISLNSSISMPADNFSGNTKVTVKGKRKYNTSSEILTKISASTSPDRIVSRMFYPLTAQGLVKADVINGLVNKQPGLTIDGTNGLNVILQGSAKETYKLRLAMGSIHPVPKEDVDIAPRPEISGFIFSEDYGAYRTSNDLKYHFSIGDPTSYTAEGTYRAQFSLSDSEKNSELRLYFEPRTGSDTYYLSYSDPRLRNLSDKDSNGNDWAFGMSFAFYYTLKANTWYGLRLKNVTGYAEARMYDPDTGNELLEVEYYVGFGQSHKDTVGGVCYDHDKVVRINVSYAKLHRDSSDGVFTLKLLTGIALAIGGEGNEVPIKAGDVFVYGDRLEGVDNYRPLFSVSQGTFNGGGQIQTADSSYMIYASGPGRVIAPANSTFANNFSIDGIAFPSSPYGVYSDDLDNDDSKGTDLFVLDLQSKINIGEIGISVGLAKNKLTEVPDWERVDKFKLTETVKDRDSWSFNAIVNSVSQPITLYASGTVTNDTTMTKLIPEPVDNNPGVGFELQIEAFRDGANINSDTPDILVAWKKLHTSKEFFKINFDDSINTEYRYLHFKIRKVSGLFYQSFLQFPDPTKNYVQNSGYTNGLFTSNVYTKMIDIQNNEIHFHRIYVSTPAKQEFKPININRLYILEKEDIEYSVYAEGTKYSKWYNPMLTSNHGKITNNQGLIVNHSEIMTNSQSVGNVPDCINAGLSTLNESIRSNESIELEIIYNPKLRKNQTVWVTPEGIGGYLTSNGNNYLHPGKIMLVDRISRSNNNGQLSTTVTLKNYR